MSSSGLERVARSVLEQKEQSGGNRDRTFIDHEDDVDITYSEDQNNSYSADVQSDDYAGLERFLEDIRVPSCSAESIDVDLDNNDVRINYDGGLEVHYSIQEADATGVSVYRKVTGDRPGEEAVLRIEEGSIEGAIRVGESPLGPEEGEASLAYAALQEIADASNDLERSVSCKNDEYFFEYGRSLEQQLGKTDADPEIDGSKVEGIIEGIEDEDKTISGRLNNCRLKEPRGTTRDGGCGISELVKHKSDQQLKSGLNGPPDPVFEEKSINDDEDRLYIANGTRIDALNDKTMYGLMVSVNKNGHQDEIINRLTVKEEGVVNLIKHGFDY
jgi:hypothetical protein